MSQNSQALNHDDSAVLKYMSMYQGIITRMAGNSAACKRFCIPFVTAILAYVITKPELREANIALLVIVPIIIFYVMDAYYLKLENQFREGFKIAAKRIQTNQFRKEHLFQLSPAGSEKTFWLKALTSPSTWIVYFGMIALVVVAQKIVDGSVVL